MDTLVSRKISNVTFALHVINLRQRDICDIIFIKSVLLALQAQSYH